MKKLSKPADALQSYLKEYQVTISQLAKDIKLSQSIVRQLTMGKAKISLNTAARLAKYFGTTQQYWTDLQYAFDLGELKNDAALNDVLKDIIKAKKPKDPPKKAAKAKAEKPVAKKGRAKKEKAADAPAPAKRGRKPAAAPADTAPKTRGRKPAEAKAAEGTVKPGRKPRAKKAETASAAVTVKSEPKKRGRKPKAKPVEEPDLQKVFKPRIELIKKKDLEKSAEEPWAEKSTLDDSTFFSNSEFNSSSDKGQLSGDDNHDDSDAE
jgi:addiction module HigA family antidote